MIQEYTWKLIPSHGRDVDQTCEAINGPVGDLMRLNPWVLGGTIELEEDHLLLTLTMKGHDRWWIRRRAPFLIASVAARSRLKMSEVKHVGIATPANLKKARFRTQDGRRVHLPPDGSEPGPQLTIRPCVNCPDPDFFHHRSGWKTGSSVEWGRGR